MRLSLGLLNKRHTRRAFGDFASFPVDRFSRSSGNFSIIHEPEDEARIPSSTSVDECVTALGIGRK